MHARLSVLLCLSVVGGPLLSEDLYEIGPDDVLHIVVAGQADMTRDFPVTRDGMLNFPALGKIKAADMSATELEKKLTTLLAQGYLKHPDVTVSIKEYRSQTVFVSGEVQKPGVYALKADRSLLGLLADIGNLGQNVGHEVIVVRPPQRAEAAEATPAAPTEIPTDAEAQVAVAEQTPGAQVFRVSLKELQSGNTDSNMRLRAGDTVNFPAAKQVYITGQVGRPGPQKFQEGATVLQMLTLAGGITSRGSGKVRIVRTANGEKKEIRAKLTDPVAPDDTIVVPERLF